MKKKTIYTVVFVCVIVTLSFLSPQQQFKIKEKNMNFHVLFGYSGERSKFVNLALDHSLYTRVHTYILFCYRFLFLSYMVHTPVRMC